MPRYVIITRRYQEQHAQAYAAPVEDISSTGATNGSTPRSTPAADLTCAVCAGVVALQRPFEGVVAEKALGGSVVCDTCFAGVRWGHAHLGGRRFSIEPILVRLPNEYRFAIYWGVTVEGV